ncbi:copper/zinc superoxide dismutase domain-containing protein [Ceratobasidium sp. AG-Ba]|nr:copper/zinc superoxide dismutase domain-containing protein [Ceratobasidium sp. AG-Ba]
MVQVGNVANRKRGRELYAHAKVTGKYGISASFWFHGNPGRPTTIHIFNMKGFTNDPSLGGPFPYHIHTNPIPPDGNCTKAGHALAHLDPLNVTEGLVCDPAFPEYCQTGDLSGKHGKFNGTDSGNLDKIEYEDAYVRFYPKSLSLLGRSIVIHSSNKTRLACGNITSYLDGTADEWMKPTYKPSNYVTSYPLTAPVQPSPPIIPFNGTTRTPDDVIATFPYPLPIPALSLYEAPNVKLGTITHLVKFNNTEQTITQPKETKSDQGPPFH